MYRPLKKPFFHQGTLLLARNLLGKYLISKKDIIPLVGKIVETEAYLQNGDPACHAYKGKTKRNEIMFGPPGHLYIYFTYGMHFCMNLVTEPENTAGAVLIRAVEPREGINEMVHNRLIRSGLKKIDNFNVANGPAKLCQAFNLSTMENGLKLSPDGIYIGYKINENDIDEKEIEISPRIGISTGKDLPWRFFIKNNPFVSKTTNQ